MSPVIGSDLENKGLGYIRTGTYGTSNRPSTLAILLPLQGRRLSTLL